MGWSHIDPADAAPVNQFYTAFLNPYVNYHRPSAQPEITTAARGRQRRRCPRYLTPLEKLLSLPHPEQYPRPGLTPAALQRVALARCDTEAARRMQAAKHTLFQQLRRAG